MDTVDVKRRGSISWSWGRNGRGLEKRLGVGSWGRTEDLVPEGVVKHHWLPGFPAVRDVA